MDIPPDAQLPPTPDAPILLVVGDDLDAGGRAEGELRRRYGADYQVISAGSADDPARLLTQLRDGGRPVSIVLAHESMSGMTGTELLAQVRQLHPAAKCLLLTEWGYGPAPEAILQAITLGHIDDYVARPVMVPDERFHLAVTELLEDWASSNRPRFEVVRVVGEEWSARSHEIRDLLDRNAVPFGFYPVGTEQGQALLRQAGPAAALPVLLLFDGPVLANPSNTEVAAALGMKTRPGAARYDVAVIGAGPAGLAAAVYGASEGLATVVLEPEAIGGQAGTSSRIRNYLGFPTGVGGGELALRAYTQAWNFGTEYVYGNPAAGLHAQGQDRVITLADGTELRSRAVVIATGVSYRRLGIPSLDALTGAGVFYGAATTEATAMKDQEVFVVGGANSAGQAAVHLARYAARVTLLVRGPSLTESMSEYLIKEITGTANIAVRPNTVVTGGGGTGRLERLTLRDRLSGTAETVPAAAVFVLIGAEPRTQWLPDSIIRDRWGFVVTGTDLMADGHLPDGWPLPRPPMFLETSLPGVFATGDVRAGSVKRVASAVGEGSIAIRLVHDYLRGS
ncbi:MAG: FAD-dependent oxidoreductase [Streptosporangiaceae bacterium]